MQLQWNRPLIIPPGGVIQTPFSLIPSNHINREQHRTRLTPGLLPLFCVYQSTLFTARCPGLWLVAACHPDPLIGSWLLPCITSIISSPLSRESQWHGGTSLGSRKSRVLLVSSRLTFDLMSQCFNLSSVIMGLMREMWITRMEQGTSSLCLGLACLLSRECECTDGDRWTSIDEWVSVYFCIQVFLSTSSVVAAQFSKIL